MYPFILVATSCSSSLLVDVSRQSERYDDGSSMSFPFLNFDNNTRSAFFNSFGKTPVLVTATILVYLTQLVLLLRRNVVHSRGLLFFSLAPALLISCAVKGGSSISASALYSTPCPLGNRCWIIFLVVSTIGVIGTTSIVLFTISWYEFPHTSTSILSFSSYHLALF